MALTTGMLKAISGLTTLAVCGGGASLVLADPRPDGAPLTPPRSTSATSSLVIPPSCAKVSIGRGNGGSQVNTGSLSAAAQKALADIQAAKGDRTKIRAILAALSPSDRQMVTAVISSRRKKPGGSNGTCPPGGSGASGGSGGTITGSVGSGGPAAPVVVSGVS